LAETIAVGDGANDIPMLKASGIGVAHHAKPKVRAEANHCLNYQDLSALSYLVKF
jgi:phosphoserine phosphatase